MSPGVRRLLFRQWCLRSSRRRHMPFVPPLQLQQYLFFSLQRCQLTAQARVHNLRGNSNGNKRPSVTDSDVVVTDWPLPSSTSFARSGMIPTVMHE